MKGRGRGLGRRLSRIPPTPPACPPPCEVDPGPIHQLLRALRTGGFCIVHYFTLDTNNNRDYA